MDGYFILNTVFVVIGFLWLLALHSAVKDDRRRSDLDVKDVIYQSRERHKLAEDRLEKIEDRLPYGESRIISSAQFDRFLDRLTEIEIHMDRLEKIKNEMMREE